jgi:hypothetical protein
MLSRSKPNSTVEVAGSCSRAERSTAIQPATRTIDIPTQHNSIAVTDRLILDQFRSTVLRFDEPPLHRL